MDWKCRFCQGELGDLERQNGQMHDHCRRNEIRLVALQYLAARIATQGTIKPGMMRQAEEVALKLTAEANKAGL